MRTEERLMTVYIAEDGKEFLHHYECESYEKELHKEEQRKEFLNKTILDEMKKIPGIIEWSEQVSLEEQAKWIDENLYIECDENRTEIGYLTAEDGEVIREEFDENCPFDISVWYKFEKEIEIKYGYTIKDSSYY